MTAASLPTFAAKIIMMPSYIPVDIVDCDLISRAIGLSLLCSKNCLLAVYVFCVSTLAMQ